MSSPNRVFQLSMLAISFLALGLGIFFLIRTFSLPSVNSSTQPTSPNVPDLEFLASQSENKSILVEVSGAVKSPSVYKLPMGSRVVDFLREAGGLAKDADAVWVERNINLAAKAEDGAKIYFPRLGEDLVPVMSTCAVEASIQTQSSAKVNINKATSGELESLWGIAAKRSEAIITGRPYSRIEDLLERKIIPANVFEAIKDKISVQ
ncbi:MAG: ComEA family DNA-binding protein [bacterium]|nr:ComEA family DNA-binding protein [bacterium]